MLLDKKSFINVPFQSTKYGKKELRVDNKKRKLSEMCIVQHVEMKSVYFSTNETTSFYECEKPAVTFWIFPLGNKNRQLCCLAVMEHIALQERRVATTRTHHLFWWNFSANHNQAPVPKKVEVSPNME